MFPRGYHDPLGCQTDGATPRVSSLNVLAPQKISTKEICIDICYFNEGLLCQFWDKAILPHTQWLPKWVASVAGAALAPQR